MKQSRATAIPEHVLEMKDMNCGIQQKNELSETIARAIWEGKAIMGILTAR
jgi:hypothetical protein